MSGQNLSAIGRLHCEQNGKRGWWSVRGKTDSPQSMTAYLDKLNPEQRRAVEHGVGEGEIYGPLLVIAGAGSGKTNTLAHRVAHLMMNGADRMGSVNGEVDSLAAEPIRAGAR